MNRCPNCAAQNRVGAKFCTSCGFRLPADEAAPATETANRNPFSTTGAPSWGSNVSTATDTNTSAGNDSENGSYASWTTDEPEPAPKSDGPGASWDASPPTDTAVPVSNEMIASLITDEPAASEPEAYVADDTTSNNGWSSIGTGANETNAADEPLMEHTDDQPAEDNEQPAGDEYMSDMSSDEQAAPPETQPQEAAQEAEPIADIEPFSADDVMVTPPPASTAPTGQATSRQAAESAGIDGLLKLVRDLEYGLIELADTPRQKDDHANLGLLTGALHDLMSDDDLQALRNAISTAQDRPRDVDVMLDLVLRADAIATVISERDQLKSAIELALRDSGADSGDND